eukprot:7824981-Alexandrium_andersonii.AAC.1
MLASRAGPSPGDCPGAARPRGVSFCWPALSPRKRFQAAPRGPCQPGPRLPAPTSADAALRNAGEGGSGRGGTSSCSGSRTDSRSSARI